ATSTPPAPLPSGTPCTASASIPASIEATPHTHTGSAGTSWQRVHAWCRRLGSGLGPDRNRDVHRSQRRGWDRGHSTQTRPRTTRRLLRSSTSRGTLPSSQGGCRPTGIRFPNLVHHYAHHRLRWHHLVLVHH